MTDHRDRASAWLIWTALIVVYVVWGSTYLAIRLVVETMPPFLSGSIRFIIAGLLIYAVLIVRDGPRVVRLTRPELAASTFVGLTLLLGGNGLVMLGERDVASGLAALIIAVVPLFVVLLRMFFGEQVRRGTLVGVLVGFAGVAVLVLPRGMDAASGAEFVAMLMLVVASASWAVGSYYSRRLELPRDPFVNTAAQLVLGGIGLAVAGLLTGELGLVQLERFSTESVLSLLYLILFGSIVAYTAYTWLLQVTSVSKVSTYAYVNPVVALLLGWGVLGEEIGITVIVGGAMIVISVGMVIRTEARPATQAGALDAPPAQSAVSEEELRAAAARD